MAELGVAASIIAVIQLCATVIGYLNNVKGGSNERQRLLNEIVNTSNILAIIDSPVKRAQHGARWFTVTASFCKSGGPIQKFKSILEGLEVKLAPAAGLKGVKKALIWPFKKEDVKEILGSIERLKTDLGLAFQSDHIDVSLAIQDSVTKLQASQEHQENRLQDKETRDLIAWLSPLNFWSKQNDIFSRRQKGTGQWVLEDGVFKQWLDESCKILWCPGIPGAGKTVVASIIINHLEQLFEGNADVGIAFIYCNYKEQGQTAVNLIASILQQVIHRQPKVPEDVVALYKEHNLKGTRPTLPEYSKLLQTHIRQLSRVFIVVDALDECSESDGTRQEFLAEVRKLPLSASLLVTSRPLTTIERDFENEGLLEISARKADVRSYVDSRLLKERRLVSNIRTEPALKEQILNTIVEKAQGMFLLAQLHMDSLSKKHNRKAIRLALKNLPEKLDDTYDEVMERISNQDKYDVLLANQVLSWITHTFRPLTIREIQHALAVLPGDTELDEEAVNDVDLLVSVCGGIVTIDRESKIVRLVHYTTQQYFERVRIARFPNAHYEIGMSCISYLSFDVFKTGPCHTDEDMDRRLESYSLLRYAAQYWSNHVREVPQRIIGQAVLVHLGHELQVSSFTQAAHVTPASAVMNFQYCKSFPRGHSAMHVAASCGLEFICELLLGRGSNPNTKDYYGQTPLSWAAKNNHETVVQLLLCSSGVDPNSEDNNRRTPLLHAAESGHRDVVQLLLDHGIDADLKDNYGRTPLFNATAEGHGAVVQQLLDRGVDADLKDNYGRTPLVHAVECGHDKVVQLLLDRGVAADLKDNYGRTPLIHAVGYGHEKVVQLLLDCGVDIDSKDNFGYTALLLAAKYGHEKVVQLLLDRGVNADSKNNDSRSPLSYAAEKGYEIIVKLLLGRADVDAESKDNSGRTPLSWAAKGGNEIVIKLLLGCAGVDAHSRDNSGRTPRSYANERGNRGVARLLADHVASTPTC